MDIDVNAVWTAIAELRVAPLDESIAMRAVIDTCGGSLPHSDWAKFSEFDYASGAAEIRAWLRHVLSDDPPPSAITGLYFGLGPALTADGQDTVALTLQGALARDSRVPEQSWVEDLTWEPRASQARSGILDAIHRLAYRTRSGLGNNAEWALCLAFAVVAIRAALTGLPDGTVGTSAINIAVGFDSGDVMLLGELSVDGFEGYSGHPH